MGCGASRVSSVVIHPTDDRSPRKNVNDVDTHGLKNSFPVTNDHKVNRNNVNEDENTQTDVPASNLESFDAKKLKVYSSVEVFVEADQRALNAPSSLKSSMFELVDYLIDNFRESDLLKLRVIWKWITNNITYDVDSFFNASDNSPKEEETQDVLVSGKSLCSGYSNLFQILGKLAGLELECIAGWSKGYSFVIGTQFRGSHTNHVWNAALLDESWWLFDCTWGAGYIDDNKNFVHEYDEHFFMADPKQFIFDHFPNNPQWQLLQTCITMDDYENMGLFTKSFFKLNMRPVSHKDIQIECNTGKLHLKFKIDKQITMKYAGALTDHEGVHTGDNFIHIYTTEKVLHTYVTAPDIGDFVLKLFADNAATVLHDDAILPLICTYLIKFTHKADTVNTYPKQFKKWCHGFMLHSPMIGKLCVGETYTFKVSVTDVSEMAVCLGGERSNVIYLKNTNATIWENDILISRGTERVTVVAKFLNCNSTTFSSILEYIVCAEKRIPP